ncbi:ribonuclease Z [Umezawaea beigongshangensis]|uniref:ribonuclease Z n=1 Tax=Umezawaea beigongshangensis TaxID=2780383 RepID=UPI0018F2143E|nr:ribonuclease Z [Umezawaea beigongshangensis]
MSIRELVVLGTASQVPTRTRSHNGYLLRWDDQGFLFDPGEGCQRQMLFAGVPVSDVTRVFVTHFHGDHCLGLPGVVQRVSLDRVPHPVHVHYPRSGQEFYERLRNASSFHDLADVRAEPVDADGPFASGDFGVLDARRLDHSLDCFGYRLTEPDGRRMLPDALRHHGISGPDVRRVQAEGSWNGVGLEQVSVPRPGQSFAFVMDTRLCDGVFALADGVDVLVIESTFLAEDTDLAVRFGHLTAAQAARVAADSGVRTLVLTHFSQRYGDPERFRAEAAEVFDGEIVVAADLDRVPVPPRR